MKKLLLFFAFLLVPSAYLLMPNTALAVCPVCTVAVGAGLGLSRWLGVDDAISGIWIGGLILSSSLWMIDFLIKKSPKFQIFPAKPTKYFKLLIIALMYTLILVPLAWTNIIGHPFNRLWGIDKLVVGIIVGSAGFWLAVWLDRKVRETRSKQLFNYQKIIFPVVALVIISLALSILVS